MVQLPEPGAEWAGFRIEEEIGEGGYGRVHAAWDPALQRRVAIKVLHRGDAGDDTVDAAVRERFLRESRIAAGLDHPRILPIHQASELDGVPYLVMRFVDGGDLRGALRQGPLSLARTVDVIGQVAGALDRAHRSGLVHRDVKPANVLCAADSGDVYLTDFGITRDIDQPLGEGLTRSGQAPASPHYASPEQLSGGAVGPTADVYSLGCTAFACLTGRVPFPGSNVVEVGHQHLQAERPSVTRHRPDLPVGLDGVLARAMAIDPAERYPTCDAFAEALDDVRAGRVAAPAVPPVVPPPPGEPAAADVDTTVVDQPTVPAPDGTSVFAAPAGGITRAGPGGRGSGPLVVEVDEGWDEAPPRSRAPFVVAGVAGLLVVVTAGLVVRAVNTGADLETSSSTTAPPTTTAAEPPSVEELLALVPASFDTCVPPPEQPGDGDHVQVTCPRDDTPELVTYTLFSGVADRDTAFADSVASLELDPGAPGECALADDAVHDYVGAGGTGRVACRTEGSRVDVVWSEADAPLLVTAGGNGFYGSHYRFWAELVGRTDATFPLPVEDDLLAELPGELLDDCRRDVGLTAQAPGVAAVACEPDDAEASVVSWVRFADRATMDAWIADRRASLGDRIDRSDDACEPDDFGETDDGDDDRPGRRVGQEDDEDRGDEEQPAPTAGATSYDEGGTSGEILCFVNSSDQNVVFWTRDGSRIGSIAVSPAASGSMQDLLEWWREGGHRP